MYILYSQNDLKIEPKRHICLCSHLCLQVAWTIGRWTQVCLNKVSLHLMARERSWRSRKQLQDRRGDMKLLVEHLQVKISFQARRLKDDWRLRILVHLLLLGRRCLSIWHVQRLSLRSMLDVWGSLFVFGVEWRYWVSSEPRTRSGSKKSEGKGRSEDRGRGQESWSDGRRSK